MNYYKVLKEGETNEFFPYSSEIIFWGFLKMSNVGLIMVDAKRDAR